MTKLWKIQQVLFPINKDELKKFLPMGMMMFFILFNYYILRDTKDTLVVNAAGAEALSLIKLIGTVPGAIVVLIIYSKMSNILSRERLFYATISPFLLFFGLFAAILYPYQDSLHPSNEWIIELCNNYPRFTTLFHVFGSWSYAMFYVLSELWGSVVLTLLFWQFANFVVKMDEAKRFYPLFGMIANIGVIAAGFAVNYFSKIRSNLAPEVDPWGVSLNYLMTAVVIAGVIIMAIYFWINRCIDLPEEKSQDCKIDKKPKLSLLKSFKTLLHSQHLGYIAILVICYGISQNVIEAVWKGQIKEVYSNQNDYNAFMGQFTMVTGMITVIFMFIGSNIVRLTGWFFSAMLTPLMILITGILFFIFVSFRYELEPYTIAMFGLTPTVFSVLLGFSQNVLSKSTKYSLFDPTKEMCYIPLSKEEKIKGKAAVDVVGGRLGKSGGALVQQILLFLTGSTLVNLSFHLALVVLVIVSVWIYANRGLNASINKVKELQPKVV